MSILTLGDNIEFVNDAAKFPVQYLKRNATTGVNEASNPTDSDQLFIAGYGHFYKSGVFERVSAQRPRPATFNIITIDGLVGSQITLGTFVPGEVVRFKISLTLVRGMKVEFHRSSGTGNNNPYGRDYWFPIKLRAGDTTSSILQRLAAQINDKVYEDNGEYPFVVTYAAVAAAADPDGAGPLTATVANNTFRLVGLDTDYEFVITVEKDIDVPSTVFTVFAPFTVSAAYEGLGQGSALHTMRLETEARNEPYMQRLQQHESASIGLSYDFVQWRMLIRRDELAYSAAADSGPVNQSVLASLYIRHGVAGNETFLTNLLTFLNLGGSPVSSVTKQLNDNAGAEVTLAAFLAAPQAA